MIRTQIGGKLKLTMKLVLLSSAMLFASAPGVRATDVIFTIQSNSST